MIFKCRENNGWTLHIVHIQKDDLVVLNFLSNGNVQNKKYGMDAAF